MSYIFSESYIRQKLRRLEEMNEYNKARLEIYSKNKSFMSKKEYERYKKILFGTDYQEQKESLANSLNQDRNKSPQDMRQKIAAQRQGQQQRQQQFQSKIKKTSDSISGNIVQHKNKQSIPFSQKSQSIRQQQKSNQNTGNRQAEYSRDQANKEVKFQTPKQVQQFQSQEDNHQQDQDNYLKQNGIFNTAQFKSTLNSSEQGYIAQQQYFNRLESQLLLNQQNQEQVLKQQQYQHKQQHHQSNSESILHQTNIADDSTFEQVQLLRNIRLLEMEKRELESQLKDLSVKENYLSTNDYTYTSKKKSSLYENAQLESMNSVQNPVQASKSFIESLQPFLPSSSAKNDVTASHKASTKSKSYYELEKSIGLDFNSQWEMLEKFGYAGKYQTTTDKLFQGDMIGPLDWLLEDSVDQQIEEKPVSNEISSVIYPQRIVHSFLPDENWEAQFNKLGKSQEKQQVIVDSKINNFRDHLNLRQIPNLNQNVQVQAQPGENTVSKHTIDRLSEEIDEFMIKIRFSSPQLLGSFSRFSKKRNLKEIPEEQQSHETTLNC